MFSVYLLNEQRGGGLRQVTDSPIRLILPVWSPDGTRAIANRLGGAALMFDPRASADRQTLEELPPFPASFAPSSWSPDGTRVAGYAFSRPGRGVVIYGVASRSYEEVTREGTGPVWLPDGRQLLYTGRQAGRHQILLVDRITKLSRLVSSSPGELLGGIDLSPDAREIYAVIGTLQSDIVLAKLTGGTP